MTGAEAALPIWREIAESGLRDGWLREGERFAVPPGVEFRTVEYRTGLAATPAAERTINEAFLAGTGPDRLYEARWGRILDLPWAQQRPFYAAKDRERMPDGLTAENFLTEGQPKRKPERTRRRSGSLPGRLGGDDRRSPGSRTAGRPPCRAGALISNASAR